MEQPLVAMETDDEEEDTLSLLEYLPSDVILEIFRFLDWNDLCQVSCTCTKFRDLCQSSTLWLNLRSLDFRNCAVPIPKNILQILNRTPNASHLVLGEVIREEEEVIEGDMDDALTPSDLFLLKVLKSCQKISHLELHEMHLTNWSVNAISAKCTVLQTIALVGVRCNGEDCIRDLVSDCISLRELVLESNYFADNYRRTIRPWESSQKLNLQKISMCNEPTRVSDVITMFNCCPLLKYVNITACDSLRAIVLNPAINNNLTIPVDRQALESLQELTLTNCPEITMVCLPYCPNLRYLDISDCPNLVEVVGTLPALQKLKTGGSKYKVLAKIKLTHSCLETLSCNDMDCLDTLEIASDYLKELNLNSCVRISAAHILTAVVNKQCLTSLDICGCENITPVDVNEILIPQLPSLETLNYGGHSWNRVELQSSKLTQLQYTYCTNTTCILLNMSQLQTLTLQGCRDFNEQELMDSFLYGKLVTRMQGLENLVSEHREQPFENDSGIPQLSCLKCVRLPGLHGDVMSHSLRHFRHLKIVQFISCTFLSNLSVHQWPSLSELMIESCNSLHSLSIDQIPTLQILTVKWCSMLKTCSIQAENLQHLDVLGTNFAQLSVTCDRLPTLHLYGVCTQPLLTVTLRCRSLTELFISKCDRLTDEILEDIFQNNPSLTSLILIGSLSLKSMNLPKSLEVCSLTGHRMLKELKTSSVVNIKHLTLNNLPKFVPADRLCFLKQCEPSLKVLEVRAIPGETTLCLPLQGLQSLTLDQGVHLASLEISCPRLRYLRIQGCPNLVSLTLHVDSLTKVQVYHSTPLLALRRLTVHSKHIVHLARVLAHYTPKLEELSLHGSKVKGSQLYRLGQNLHQLQTVTLNHCDVTELENHGTSLLIESQTIDRTNNKHLLVQFIN